MLWLKKSGKKHFTWFSPNICDKRTSLNWGEKWFFDVGCTLCENSSSPSVYHMHKKAIAQCFFEVKISLHWWSVNSKSLGKLHFFAWILYLPNIQLSECKCWVKTARRQIEILRHFMPFSIISHLQLAKCQH